MQPEALNEQNDISARRNTRKNKKKENKRYPYKKTRKTTS